VYRDRVTVFEFIIGGLVPESLDLGTAVSGEAGCESSNLFCHGMNMRNGLGNHKTVGNLPLGDNSARVGPSYRHTSETRGGGCGFKRVFHLIKSTLGGEDSNVMIIVRVSAHFV